MTTLTMVTENEGRLRIVEFVAKILSIQFTKTKDESYSEDFLRKIERGNADYEAGKCTPLKPSDVWS